MTKQETITDPARLLPAESMHPFWVENRRREIQFKRIAQLVDYITKLIREYEFAIYQTYRPVGSPKFSDSLNTYWEDRLQTDVFSAFIRNRHAIKKALNKWESEALQAARDLWIYQGMEDDEYLALLRLDELPF